MADSNIVPVNSSNAPRYRYYTVDIVSNTVIGEIPFEDVTYQRALKQPGTFDGKITISSQTKDLDLYNATLPGKTAIYVVRDTTAVWGGIIWGRTYDLMGRSLAISASEFTSYLSKRFIWKPYSSSFTADLFKPRKNGATLVTVRNQTLREPIRLTDDFGNKTKVEVTFVPAALRKYNGFYEVVGINSTPVAGEEDPKNTAFYVNIPTLPVPSEGVYNNVGVTIRTDTYDYLKDLLSNVFDDFIYLDFPNEIIEPGVTKVVEPYSMQMTRINNDYGIATIVCETEHELVSGQRVELANLSRFLDGVQTVLDIPTPKSFRFNVINPVDPQDQVTRIYLDNSLANTILTGPLGLKTEITAREQRQFRRESVTNIRRVSGVVTLTLYSPHQFEVGQKVIAQFVNKKPVMFPVYNTSTKKTVNTNTLMPTGGQAMVITAVTENTISYVDSKYVEAKYNIAPTRLDVNDLAKNYVESSEARNILRVYPKNSHGFNINDRVTVVGVDDFSWEYPRYDGNFRLFEVDPGIPRVVKKYQVASKVINGVSTNVLRVHLDSDPSCREFDVFLLDGFANNISLDGEYVALGPAVLENGLWVVETDDGGDLVALTTLSESPTFSINGSTWVEYLPTQSELRSNLKREPGTEFPFTFMAYVPAKGKTPNRVTLTTGVRHNLVVGDRITLDFGNNTADQTIYGGAATVTAINSAFKFTYSIPAGKKDSKGVAVKIPTAAFSQEKTGNVYRAKTTLVSTVAAYPEVRIRSIGTTLSGSINTAYVDAPNHGFSEGDKVSLALDHGYHRDLTNRGEPVEILRVPNENTFTYATDITKRDKKEFDIINIEYNSNFVNYTIKGYAIEVNQPEFKANVTSMVAAGKNSFGGSLNRITATLDANIFGNVREGAGAQIQFYNMPDAETRTVTPPDRIDGVYEMSYDGYFSLTITTPDPHGLDPVLDIGATVTLTAGPTFLEYPFNTTKVGGLDISSLYIGPMKVERVTSALSFTVFYSAGYGVGPFKSPSAGWVARNLGEAPPTPEPESPRLAGLSYDAATRLMTLDMSSNSFHYLSNNDINSLLSISGFDATVSAVNNSTGAILDTSFINGSWRVRSVPSITSVVVSVPSGPTTSFSVFNINGQAGSPNTIVDAKISSLTYSPTPTKTATLTLLAPLPSTPTSVTTATISGTASSATSPGQLNLTPPGTSRSLAALPGAYSINTPYSRNSINVSVDLGSGAFQAFGTAVSNGNISVNFNSGVAAGVAVPTITTAPNPLGVDRIPMTIKYKTRILPVEGSFDLRRFNYTEGNTWSILGELDSAMANVVSVGTSLIDTTFNVTGLSSITPKPYLRVPPSTWLDVETGAPYIEPGSKINIFGLQGPYSVFDDLNVEVLEWTPSDFVGGIPTAIISVRYKDYVKGPIPPEGLPVGGSVSIVKILPGTAYLNPATSTDRSKEITHISRASNGTTATITSAGHGFNIGDFIYVTVYGTEYAAFSQARQKVVITAVTEDTITYELQKNTKIKSYSGMKPWEGYLPGTALGTGVNQLRFAGTGAHNICYGDFFTVSNLSALIDGTDVFAIATGPSSITINSYENTDYPNRTSTTGTVAVTYYAPIDVDAAGYILEAPSMGREPVVLVKSYGEYPRNASIGGISFSTNEYSSKSLTNSPLAGSQLASVADILQKYTDTIEGFEYRIDVKLTEVSPGVRKFERIFVLIPIYPESLTQYLATLPGGKLAKGQVAHPVAFGADKIVFEYPGNTSNVSLAENAENSATRMFVVGNNNRAATGAETPYSAAADIKLLSDGWPLLDAKQTQEWPIKPSPYANLDKLDNYDDETGFYRVAEKFLAESKPPVGDFIISVNGSLNPVIGSYNPGDWCSVIINDEFVKTRLNSVLEPRKDVLVRKIDSISVSVPNNPAFPEQINLQLTTNWQVDEIGK